jgi:hypothetical protein
VDYSIACNRGVLDVASRMKENFQYNRYVMGRNSIERGSRDTWTVRPHRYDAVAAEVAAAGGAAGAASDAALWAALRKPEYRDPRAYIIPADQPDFPTATKFVNALLETGIRVHRARRSFTVQDKTYPHDSFVVFTSQAFRPHVIDMFEPQDHPDVFPYAGAPPTRPYDNAGWTLAFQMGVEFDRILEPFTGPFDVVAEWNLPPPPGIAGEGSHAKISPDQLDAFTAVNRFLAAGHPVVRRPDGAFVATLPANVRAVIGKLGLELGVNLGGASAADAAPGRRLTRARIGLWDQYGGSMDSGWARWILEQFEFPFARVYAPELDAGNLGAKFDTLIFVDGGIPGGGGGGRGGAVGAGRGVGGGGRGGGAAPLPIPAEFQSQIGSVTVERTLPQLKAFMDAGGTVVAIGASATNLARFLRLPMTNHLVENGVPLPQTKFYAPGSVLQVRVDTSSPVAAGMKAQTDVFFDNSPVWTLGPDAAAKGVRPVAWFDSATPLRSGWAFGQSYLKGGVVAVDAAVGKGRALLFGAEILQRAQPHGTFKFLFNSIYLSR